MVRTIFIEKFDKAVENKKIVFYDYLEYKKYIGWYKEKQSGNWKRPLELKSAMYNADYIKKLPDANYLGIPVKDIIKSNLSDGCCHACVVALSLCYDDFNIVTCNLKNYADYYNANTKKVYVECYDLNDIFYDKRFEHSFLLLDDKWVVDTTFGILTDIETYNDVMNVQDAKVITKEEISKTKIYQFLIKNKHLSLLANLDFNNIISEYINDCKHYKNTKNKHLEDFISRCLYSTTDNYSINKWIQKNKFENVNYPSRNMFSLKDDKKDKNLGDAIKYIDANSFRKTLSKIKNILKK